MSSTKVICLTPIKNESWILDRFLQAASEWADHIIVADQGSTDNSRELVKKYKKAILIDNPSTEFNEPERQKLLISEARKIPGKKLLIALDADEFISGNVLSSQDWLNIKEQSPGTVINFIWPFVNHSFDKYWLGKNKPMPFGYMDDGAEHSGKKIHSNRLPTPDSSNTYNVKDFVVMHFQFTDWKRMESKHRWYQCYERISYPTKSNLSIFRMYNHMYQVNASDFNDIPSSWFTFYSDKNIDLKNTINQEQYYWDHKVEEMINEYGRKHFEYIDLPGNSNIVLQYLRWSRSFNSILIKVLDRLISKLFKL
jgi:glycosyltransferase involved in cell wall biosynthesis